MPGSHFGSLEMSMTCGRLVQLADFRARERHDARPHSLSRIQFRALPHGGRVHAFVECQLK